MNRRTTLGLNCMFTFLTPSHAEHYRPPELSISLNASTQRSRSLSYQPMCWAHCSESNFADADHPSFQKVLQRTFRIKQLHPSKTFALVFLQGDEKTLGADISWGPLALELPLSTTHWAKGDWCLRIDPLEYAVKMEGMVAGAPDERAIVTRELTIRAAAIKCHPAYAACLILCVPCPRSHCMPLKNLDLHFSPDIQQEMQRTSHENIIYWLELVR